MRAQAPAVQSLLLGILVVVAATFLYFTSVGIIQEQQSSLDTSPKLIFPLRSVASAYKILDGNFYICVTLQNPNDVAVEINDIRFIISSGLYSVSLSTCGSEINAHGTCTLCFSPDYWNETENVKIVFSNAPVSSYATVSSLPPGYLVIISPEDEATFFTSSVTVEWRYKGDATELNVDCGNGSVATVSATTTSYTCSYSSNGTYTITVAEVGGELKDSVSIKIITDLYINSVSFSDANQRYDVNVCYIGPSSVETNLEVTSSPSGISQRIPVTVPAGGCATVSFTPFPPESNTYTLTFTVDPDNVITESDETNNTATSTNYLFFLDPNETHLYLYEVNNPTTATEANYTVLLTIDTNALISSGLMRADCNDIRIYNDRGEKLAYWIEEMTCDTNNTRIWVKVPELPPGDTNVLLFFGGSYTTSETNGDATFLFFDDFESTSLDLSIWASCNEVNLEVNNGLLYLEGAGGSPAYVMSLLKLSSPGYVIYTRFKAYTTGANTTGHTTEVGFYDINTDCTTDSIDGTHEGAKVRYDSYGNNGDHWEVWTYNTARGDNWTFPELSDGVFYRIKLGWYAAEVSAQCIDCTDTNSYSVTSQIPDDPVRVTITATDSTIYVDWIALMKSLADTNQEVSVNLLKSLIYTP